LPAVACRYDAIVFDLLTGLIDSLTLWNAVAGSAEDGMRWRGSYLDLTHREEAYRPYRSIVREAARRAGLDTRCADRLVRRWGELAPWPETQDVVRQLSGRVPLGIATNCSQRLGSIAARRGGDRFAVIVTAEEVGFYKPRPEPYRAVLSKLGTEPARTLFVAGSAHDVPGAQRAGMPVFWHSRMGLVQHDDAKPAYDAKPDYFERSLRPLLDLV
jgi:2-haloacid dehalogenase